MDLKEIKKIYPEKPVGQAIDITGEKINKWTVLYRADIQNNKNRAMWVCQCECGTIKPVDSNSLRSGNTKSCGCLQSEQNDKKIHIRNEEGKITLKRCYRCKQFLPLNNFWKSSSQKDGHAGECIDCYNTAKESRYHIYKKGAISRGLEFNLSKEDFYNLTNKICYYCGDFSEDKNYTGIDRIDSNKGYDLNNCVPCCEMCNRMKLNYDKDKWIKKMKQIINNMESKND